MLAVAFFGCDSPSGQEGPSVPSPARSAQSTTTVVRLRHTPPTPKGVVVAALQSTATPLSTHASCAGVGSESSDTTPGEFLASFLVELNPEHGQGGIATKITQEGDGWLCTVMIQRSAGEELWSWGSEFRFDASGTLVPGSYRCLGAG